MAQWHVSWKDIAYQWTGEQLNMFMIRLNERYQRDAEAQERARKEAESNPSGAKTVSMRDRWTDAINRRDTQG